MISEGKDVLKCVNDALLHDVNLEKNFWKTCNYISLCDKNGITFNPKKFQFGQDEVKFAGFKIIKSHMRPQREYLQAILDFPKPTDITVVRSWFGLVNQVVYSFCMTRHMELFRAVHKPAQIFQWDEHLEEAFVMSKKEIVKAVEEGVRIFDMNRTTCLAPDWCKSGVGFFLLQKYCRCTEVTPRCFPEGWKLVFAGARFCSPAEAKHKPVEGEALAVVNGLQKCRYFVLGCKDLVVGTNHKPLLKVLGDRRLEDIKNPRLESLKEKTLRYKFKMVHVPGRLQVSPDALSRYASEAGKEVQIAGVANTQEVRRDVLRKMRTLSPNAEDPSEVEQLCTAKVMATLRAEQTLKAVT